LTILEIVDQPVGSFNDNLNILTNSVQFFEPNYNNNQLDILEDRYVFSLSGKCQLVNNNILDFVISFKINMNSYISQQVSRLEQLVCLDFIKIKI
jgi:hypothetical protein